MNTTWQKTITCIVLLAFTTACTSMRPIVATDATMWHEQLSAGDEVHVRRNDGSEVLFTIEALDDEGISGGGFDVAYTDIAELSVKQVSAPRSTALGVGILFGVVLIGLLMIDEDDIFPGVGN
ncbi:MAG: hypothetical protein KJO82_13380 [Gammaproteobacteria bacterium]|nr:hypothetical protein [Gammaproteobacteria bacterium]